MFASARKYLLVAIGVSAIVLLVASAVRRHATATPRVAASAEAIATRTAPLVPAAARPIDLAEAFTPRGSMSDHDALEAARAIADPVTRGEVFGRLLQRWLVADFAAAVAYVRTLPDGPVADAARMQALEIVLRRDRWSALETARDLATTPATVVFYSELFDTLARSDRDRAAHALAELPMGAARDNAVRALVDMWAQADFKAALTWAREQSDSADRAAALETALRVRAKAAPREAIELAVVWLPAAERDRLVEVAIEPLVASDLSAAAALVREIPAGDAATRAAIAVARAQASQDPSAALAWASTLPRGDVQRLATVNALDVWSASDAHAAMTYVAGLAAGPEQAALAGELARIVGGRSPTAAVAFAESLTDAAARGQAATAAASAWARTDPASACRWAATLTDPANSAPAVSGALSYWLLADRAAATAWAEQLAPGETREAAFRLLE